VDRQILSEDNASFAYVDIKQVGRELGVRYVLEGILQALKTHRREVVAKADVRHHDQVRCEPPQRSADHHRA
jgi:TolB-like protein